MDAGQVWDLIVVGAGPAGAAAALQARLLSPGSAVLLLDKAAFPRDKPCGDGIAPHVADELARLGAAAALDGYPPIHRLRIRVPGGGEVAGRPARPARVIPRVVFDARLVEAAVARGAVLRRERVRTLEERRGVVVVNGELAGRALVGADGANSAVRRLLGVPLNPPGDLAIALRGYAPAGDGPLEQFIGWVPEGWPAYVWSFPTGTGLTNVGYGLLRSRFAGGRAELSARLAALLPWARPDQASLRAHHLPFSTHRPRPGRGRVLLAGDAASLVNPLSGEGIYYALASGRLAATAAVLATADPAGAYRQLLARSLGRHFRHSTVLARAIRSRRLAAAAMLAAGASPALFDAMVEMGLGQARLTAGLAARLPPAYLRARAAGLRTANPTGRG
jgi:menaquinone-9 beta-reductase